MSEETGIQKSDGDSAPAILIRRAQPNRRRQDLQILAGKLRESGGQGLLNIGQPVKAIGADLCAGVPGARVRFQQLFRLIIKAVERADVLWSRWLVAEWTLRLRSAHESVPHFNRKGALSKGKSEWGN